jgi:hypothetical protein
VHDAARVRVREAVEDLGGDVDRHRVGDAAGTQCLAERRSGHVCVGDVDVLRVAPAGERARARGVVQLRHRLRLAARSLAGFALARDDLHGHVAPVLFVARQPDGARAAAPERPYRAVAAEEQTRLRTKGESFGHGSKLLCRRRSDSFPIRRTGYSHPVEHN